MAILIFNAVPLTCALSAPGAHIHAGNWSHLSLRVRHPQPTWLTGCAHARGGAASNFRALGGGQGTDVSSRWEPDTPFWLLHLGSGIHLRRRGPGGGEGSGRGPELPQRPSLVPPQASGGSLRHAPRSQLDGADVHVTRGGAERTGGREETEQPDRRLRRRTTGMAALYGGVEG